MTVQEKTNDEGRKRVKNADVALGVQSETAGIRPSEVPANEETEGVTGALETPATPPEMTKDGKVDRNERDR